MPAPSKRRSKPLSPAAKARKAAGRYLTPIANSAGGVIGYRFAPGPHLRGRGASSKILKHADGRFFSFAEAQAYRDAALAGDAEICALQPHAAPERPISLRQLWTLYEAAKAAEIEANEKLPREKRDEDVIRPGTLRFYRSTIKPWLKFAHDEETGEDLPAAALDRDTVKAEYKNQKAQRSHHSAAASLGALQAVFAFGHPKYVPTNPTLNLDLAGPPGRLRLGSPAEMAALVNAADEMAREAKDGDKRKAFTSVGDAIVAGLWTAQRQGDVLDCDLGRQLQREDDALYLIFARTHDHDFSQSKTGGRAHVLVLPPLAERMNGREIGRLAPGPNGGRWKSSTFREYFDQVRARAAQKVASVADFQYRDLRDTGITRLHLAGIGIADIALWSGHSMKRIYEILEEHYLVATREAARNAGERFEAWRQRTGIKW